MLKNIIFDLGGVLIDWNPRRLFSEVFKNQVELDYFLSEICSMEWNEAQDAGRSIKAGTWELVVKYPEYEEQIRRYYDEWTAMLGGVFEPNIGVLEKLFHQKKYRLFALTNWSAETFPIAEERFPFLQWFEGLVVSGRELLKKPDPAFYQILMQRYEVSPPESLFIDDNPANIHTAQTLGFQTIHLPSGENVEAYIGPFLSS